ncbi:sporulation-like protein BofC [Salipaludibacillus keqinensis]|uniref:Sporulation-like protein BofC n=2 Tax=Salipaludibacillus keqinensis TaxID=2045207 RepID=A0A323TML4_9BACI|nr:sporulation-like protein BofC [Salipaludibacillus keqinensis]
MTLCACTLIIFLIMFTSPVLIGKMKVSASESLVSDQPHEVEVLLQRQYLDGEMSEEELEETIWSMEDFWSYYDEWELVDQNKDQIVFRKEINDISPLMKMHGYFGIEDDGTLSIYNGKPTENEVIQSFFQINTKQLKSHLHESLLEGIPVSTKDEYLEVLKIYQKYAINGL